MNFRNRALGAGGIPIYIVDLQDVESNMGNRKRDMGHGLLGQGTRLMQRESQRTQ